MEEFLMRTSDLVWGTGIGIGAFVLAFGSEMERKPQVFGLVFSVITVVISVVLDIVRFTTFQ